MDKEKKKKRNIILTCWGKKAKRLAHTPEMYRKLQVEQYEHMKLKERLIRGFAID